MTILSIVALTIAVWGQRLLGGFVFGPMLNERPVSYTHLTLPTICSV